MKPCKSHQYRHVSGRCRNKTKREKANKMKKEKVKLKTFKVYEEPDPSIKWPDNKPEVGVTGRKWKPCKDNFYRHISGKCRKKKVVLSYDVDKNSTYVENNKCKTNDMLKPLQRIIVNFMTSNNNGLILSHSTGCGKTISSIAVSECYLSENRDNNIVLIASNLLISNFKKEMLKYNVKDPSRYSYYSYNKFLNIHKNRQKSDCNENTLLIVDEAHNLRNTQGAIYHAVMKDAAMISNKRLLLTATPFMNNIIDLTSLINLVYGEYIFGRKKDVEAGDARIPISRQKSRDKLNIIYKLLAGKIDLVDCTDIRFYPKEIETYVDINMGEEYRKMWEKTVSNELPGFKNFDVFYNGYRRLVNRSTVSAGYYSHKLNYIEKALNNLDKSKRKSVIYSNWISYGVDTISNSLAKSNMSYRIITGDTENSIRDDIINDYNNDLFDILVITKVGGEGLDLKGVRNIFILDPPWNYASVRQIVGRGVRYNSHAHLKTEDRVVNVYYLRLVDKHKKIISGDAILYNFILKKEKLQKEITKHLANISISKGKI